MCKSLKAYACIYVPSASFTAKTWVKIPINSLNMCACVTLVSPRKEMKSLTTIHVSTHTKTIK